MATAFAEKVEAPAASPAAPHSHPISMSGASGPPISALSARTASIRDCFECKVPNQLRLSICVLGASGDLAKKKTYPALFALYSKGFLPAHLQVVGYARSQMTAHALREQLRPYLKGPANKVDAFLELCDYRAGEYADPSPGYDGLAELCREHEGDGTFPIGRLFYLALPPFVYPQVCKALRGPCSDLGESPDPRSWVRIIVEKPFGKDLASSEELSEQLGALFPEEQLYRIDHYLGKEMAQNMLVMRFANPIFGAWWNRHFISNVQISFKEDFGTQGRGGYFDSYGIIRDVIQNHLTQLLALVAMEQPVNSHPDDIRDEKCKVLRCIHPVKPEDCILGQYTAGKGEPGYLDDPTVPRGSKAPTFAACKLIINNERWAGVPFVLRAGKALNERGVVIRVQLLPQACPLYNMVQPDMRNELVMRLQPGEAMWAKMVVKAPGLEMAAEMSELDLSYGERYQDTVIPEAYERLILDCIRGDQQHFVRRDELRAAWAIFTPLLHAIDAGQVDPEPYEYGSRGPASQEAFLASTGYVRSGHYTWRPRTLEAAAVEAANAIGVPVPVVTPPQL